MEYADYRVSAGGGLCARQRQAEALLADDCLAPQCRLAMEAARVQMVEFSAAFRGCARGEGVSCSRGSALAAGARAAVRAAAAALLEREQEPPTAPCRWVEPPDENENERR